MRVLIGVDDSAESRHAVDTAFEFFGSDAEYLVASFGERMPFYSTSFAGGSIVSSVNLSEQFDAAADAARQRAITAAAKLPLDSEIVFDVGHAGRSLCDLAEDQHVNAIVIGSQDKTVWERLLDPSVGRYLIDHAPCPVVVVR